MTITRLKNNGVPLRELSSSRLDSLSYVIEKANVISTAPAGILNVDVLSDSVHLYTSAATSSVTFNIRGNATTTLNGVLSVGESITATICLTQGITGYTGNVHIDGNPHTVRWAGNLLPSATANNIDVYTLTSIKTGTNTYTVLGSKTNFGSA